MLPNRYQVAWVSSGKDGWSSANTIQAHGLYSYSSAITGIQSVARQELLLLVPATSSNHHLCQLLLSAAVLGYPAPILINWGAPEDEDDYVQHLAKVETILNHLNALPSDRDNDLYFMIDGYDAWFQLSPDILIQRYHSLVAKSSQRYPQGNVKDVVIFGQDKLCWPGSFSRAACWAVPNSTLPTHAFGPDTDHGIAQHNRPRWLNSGTIMGPVKDVRDVFAATLEMIRANHTENSDQFYFANLFAAQAYARGPIDADEWPQVPLPNGEEREYPKISSGQRTEYGIGIDYESAIFQTVAYYEDSITFNTLGPPSSDAAKSEQSIETYYQVTLPPDLLSSSPADLLKRGKSLPSLDDLPEPLRSWSSVPLGFNTVTKQVFPILHFTGKKGYREMWWHRNWFYPYAENILHRLQQSGGDAPTGKMQRPGVAGVWTTDPASPVLSWEYLCGMYEDYLFGRR